MVLRGVVWFCMMPHDAVWMDDRMVDDGHRDMKGDGDGWYRCTRRGRSAQFLPLPLPMYLVERKPKI